MSYEISIVVPVYNSEKYLSECLDSILAQSYTNFELLLIDDGSTDFSGKICDEYDEKYDFVTVYHNQNSGAAGARLFGTKKATGKYITYIDCDDFVAENYLEVLYSAIKKFNADIATAGRSFLLPDGSLATNMDTSLQEAVCLTGSDSVEQILYGKFCTTFCGNKLYRSEIITEIMPLPLKFGEDTSVTVQALAKARQVVHTGEILYFYRQHSESATHTKNNERFYDYVRLSDYFIDYFSSEAETVKKAVTVNLVENNLYAYMKIANCENMQDEKKHISENIRKYRMNVILNKNAPMRTRLACIVSFAGMKTVKAVRDKFDKTEDKRRL